MSITIKDKTTNPVPDYVVEDKNKDGKVNDDFNKANIDPTKTYSLTVDGKTVELKGDALTKLFAQTDFVSGDNKALKDLLEAITLYAKAEVNEKTASEIINQLKELGSVKSNLDQALKDLSATPPTGSYSGLTADQAKALQEIVKQQLQVVQQQIENVQNALKNATITASEDTKKDINKALTEAGGKEVDFGNPDPTKKTPDTSPPAKYVASGGGGSGGSSSGATGPTSGPKWGVGVPDGPQTWFEGDNGLGMNPSSLMQMDLFNDAKLSAIDQLGKSEQQRRVMLLFFYFARMAMSGDMGAMYQFMMFLTTIISRDKALQNINMGKLLIQQQDMSRAATNELMKVQANMKPGDDDAARELQIQLQKTKQTEGDVATSQKLISQMMEEMTQVVETLTNATKGALEAQGRILRSVSRIG